MKRLGVRDMCYIALMAVVIAVCSWVSVPGDIPFTMQTFGVFCALGLLGGRRGTLAAAVYILLGAVGLPVFAGFAGGVGRLLGVTGGYIVGFLFMGLTYWLVTALGGNGVFVRALGMLLGLAVCYAFGTAWFVIAYAASSGAIGFAAAAARCVVPYIVPDLIKLALALTLTAQLAPRLKLAE